MSQKVTDGSGRVQGIKKGGVERGVHCVKSYRVPLSNDKSSLGNDTEEPDFRLPLLG